MITLGLISQLLAAGASVMFSPVETATPVTSYYNEFTEETVPCGTIMQEEGLFNYCEVSSNDWVIFTSAPDNTIVRPGINLGMIATLATKGENVIFRKDDYAGRITSFSTEGVEYPCYSVQQKEGDYSYCRLEYKEVNAVNWLVFSK